MHSTQTPPSSLRAAPGGQPALTSAEVMTPAEVAELLQLPISTVYYLARHGQLPHSRLGRTYRFLRPQLEDLLTGGER